MLKVNIPKTPENQNILVWTEYFCKLYRRDGMDRGHYKNLWKEARNTNKAILHHLRSFWGAARTENWMWEQNDIQPEFDAFQLKCGRIGKYDRQASSEVDLALLLNGMTWWEQWLHTYWIWSYLLKLWACEESIC